MATEVTEYAGVPIHFGSYVPVRPIAFLRHKQLALGTVLTVGQDTTLLTVAPAEDCRYNTNGGNGSQPDPASPSAGNYTDYPLLKAGGRYDFEVAKGTKVIFS